MSMFTSFNISASGMTAQQLRTDVISENIANANTTRTSDGTPYVRKAVVFTEKTLSPATYVKGASAAGSSFASILHNASGGRLGDGVKVTSVYEDDSTDMNLVYDPSHPDAGENGYVTYPNVNIVQEMTDLLVLDLVDKRLHQGHMRLIYQHLMPASPWHRRDLLLVQFN